MLAVKRVLTTFLAVAAIAVSMCFVALSLLLAFTPARAPDDEPLWALGEDDRATLERHVTEFLAAQQQKMPYNKPVDWIVDLTQIKREVVRHMLLVDRQNNNGLKRQRSVGGVSSDGDDPSAFANLLLLTAADGGGNDGTTAQEEKVREEDDQRRPPPSWTARVNTEAFGKRWLSSPWLFKNAEIIPSSSPSPTPASKTIAVGGNETSIKTDGSSLVVSSVPSITIRTTTPTPSPASDEVKIIDVDGKTVEQNGGQEMKLEDDSLPLLFSAHYERHLLGLSRRRNRLPEEFDVSRRWPSCFVNGLVPSSSSISNGSQWTTHNNTCGSCWALTASSVIADRLCIARAKHRQQKQQQQQKGTTATGGQKTLFPGINFTAAADQSFLPSVLAEQLTECCRECPNFQRGDEQRGPDFFAPFLHWFKVGLSMFHWKKQLIVNNVSSSPYSRAEMNCSTFERDKMQRNKAKYVYRLGSIGGEGGFFPSIQKTATNSSSADLPSLFAFHRQWLVENNRRRRLHQQQQQKQEKNGGRFGPSATTISNPFYSFQYFNSIPDVEQLLRRELMEHGPVMLCLPAFEGLMHYFEGVYDFALQPNELYLNEHCVKVVGWGRRMRPGAKLHWKMPSASAIVQKGKNRQKANSQQGQQQLQEQQQNFLLATSPWSAKWAKDGILKIDLDRLREFPNELFAGVPDDGSLGEEAAKLSKNGH